MAKRTLKEFMKELKEELKDGIKNLPENTEKAVVESLKSAPGQIFDEFKQKLGHGSQELVNALMTGQAFVLYPRGFNDQDKDQGKEVDKVEAQMTPQKDQDNEMER